MPTSPERATPPDLAAIVDGQNEIIKTQSDMIDRLFLLLLQHEEADEIMRVMQEGGVENLVLLRKRL